MWDTLEGKFDELREFLDTVPKLLRAGAIASLVLGMLAVVTPFVPGRFFEVGGIKLSRTELWATGVAFALFTVGPLMVALGLGIFHRRRWTRTVLLVMPILQTLPFQVVHWVFAGPKVVEDLVTVAIAYAVWFVVAALYLTSQGVRAYYGDAP